MAVHDRNLEMMRDIFRADARRAKLKYECFSCGQHHHMTNDNIVRFYEGGYSEEYFCDQCIIAGRHTKLGGY